MIGLLLKDFYNMKKVLGIYILFPIVIAIFCFINGDLNLLVFIPSFMGMFAMITSFAYDEMSRFQEYALALPLLKKDIVNSKYFLVLITMILFFLLAFLCAVILLTMPERFPNDSLLSFLVASVSSMAAIIILTMILIPVIFKYGTEKARVVLMFGFLIVALGGGLLWNMTDIASVNFSWLLQNAYLIPWFVVGVTILAILLSIHVSKQIMEHKEF